MKSCEIVGQIFESDHPTCRECQYLITYTTSVPFGDTSGVMMDYDCELLTTSTPCDLCPEHDRYAIEDAR